MIGVERYAAFCDGDIGGNPAGVVLCSELPAAAEMQSVAREVGYSETVFAAPVGNSWRARYFAPQIEVPFCGHATIALGGALAKTRGSAVYDLILNEAEISVEGKTKDGGIWAALQSPRTATEEVSSNEIEAILELFSYKRTDLDERIPVVVASAGARHLVLAVKTRDALRNFHYDFDEGRQWMLQAGITTVLVAFSETRQLFHTRNAFAAGGVYEDAATGAATAAFAGYLRQLAWPCDGAIQVVQGEDMGCRSLLFADFTPELGASIRVSGEVRSL